MTSVLSVRGVVAAHRGIPVVHGIDLEVAPGEIVGILGRNGMGKSSLLDAIFGIVARPSGTVAIDGREIAPLRPELIARAGVSYLPEDRGVLPNLTVAENLALARRSTPPPVDPRSVYPLLTGRAKQAAGTLSGGQQQQLGIARAVIAGSRLIAIDELTHGLQPSMVRDTFQLLRDTAVRGVGVLVVDQNPELVAASCDRVLVIEAGRVTLDKKVEEGVLAEVSELLILK